MTENRTEISPVEFVKILKRRVKKDWDAVVGITGEEGVSKSTLASWLVYLGCIEDGMTEAEALEKFVDYTIFSPNSDRVQEQITKSERYSIINADEAIKILYKQNWASPIQKFLNMFYAICRQENKISILCMPRFLDFNEFFRNHRIKFWIHVVDRGVGVIFERDWFPSSADPWFLKDSQKINYLLYNRKKASDFNTEQKILSLAKLKNFVGVVRFDDLPTKLKHKYLEKKAEYAYEDIKEQISSGETSPGKMAEDYKLKLTKAAQTLRSNGMTVMQISILLNTSKTTILKYLNGQVAGVKGDFVKNKPEDEDIFVQT